MYQILRLGGEYAESRRFAGLEERPWRYSCTKSSILPMVLVDDEEQH